MSPPQLLAHTMIVDQANALYAGIGGVGATVLALLATFEP